MDTKLFQVWLGFVWKIYNTIWNSQLLKAIEADRTLQSKLQATKKLGNICPHELAILRELTILLQTDDLQGDFETCGNVISCYLDLLNKVIVTVKDVNRKLYSNPACPFAAGIKNCKDIADDPQEFNLTIAICSTRNCSCPRYILIEIRNLNSKSVFNIIQELF